MNARQLPERDYLALKAAFRDLCAKAGDVTRAATVTRVPASTLSSYKAPTQATQAPIDVIADLEAEVGEPIVTRLLAELAGYVLVPVNAIDKPVESIDAASAQIMRATGEALSKIGAALADGVMQPAEAHDIRASTREARDKIVILDEAVGARAARGR